MAIQATTVRNVLSTSLLRLLAIALCAQSTCRFALGQTQEPIDMTAVVAAWNVKGIPVITTARAEQIALGIAYLDPEVIVLTEVAQADKMPIILDRLNSFGSNYSFKMPAQTAGLKIAILFKEGVTVDNVDLIEGSDAGDPTFRKVVTANVEIGKFDFVVIGVHLKSGRGGTARNIRNKQVALIATFISAATASNEKDVLVVGDYNMIPPTATSANDEQNFQVMDPNDFLQFISSEDLLGQRSHLPRFGVGNLLDGYAISFDHTNEYIEGSLRIFPLHRTFRMSLSEYRRRVSDHLPLVARFDITEDDD